MAITNNLSTSKRMKIIDAVTSQIESRSSIRVLDFDIKGNDPNNPDFDTFPAVDLSYGEETKIGSELGGIHVMQLPLTAVLVTRDEEWPKRALEMSLKHLIDSVMKDSKVKNHAIITLADSISAPLYWEAGRATITVTFNIKYEHSIGDK